MNFNDDNSDDEMSQGISRLRHELNNLFSTLIQFQDKLNGFMAYTEKKIDQKNLDCSLEFLKYLLTHALIVSILVFYLSYRIITLN